LDVPLTIAENGRAAGFQKARYSLNDFLLNNVDAGGHRELIVVGTNNEYRRGCLIVFDSTDIRGSSPQTKEEYVSKEPGPGSEKSYVLLPRTDLEINQALQGSIVSVDRLSNGELSMVMKSTVLNYEFSSDLSRHEVRSSHQFEQAYTKALREGTVQGELNQEYYSRLNEGIRYWTGKEWTPTPTKIRRIEAQTQ